MGEQIRRRLLGARVLVVEDDPQVCSSVRRVLERDEVRVTTCECGVDGLIASRNAPPDAILLDLGLPDIEGFEVLRRLRATAVTARVPVLVLTGRVSVEVHAEALELGADDFISKPADRRVLRARLANLVGRARAETANARLVEQLGRYVSQPARRNALTPRSMERLDATILMSDLRGFTQQSFSTDPSAMFEAVSLVLAGQAEIVRHYGGYVDKFSGDGMLAVFGDRTGPAQACAASREILRWARSSGAVPMWSPVPISVGVHAGAVLRGDVGGKDRRDHTVIGPAVNVAARLCAVAGPVEGIVSEHVVQAVMASAGRTPEALGFAEMPDLCLKGLPGPMAARRIVF